MARKPQPPPRPVRPVGPVRTWSATRMPKLRDQTVTALADPNGFIHSLMAGKANPLTQVTEPMLGPYGIGGDGAQPGELTSLGRDLAQAALYWVTEPMAALAVSSAATLDEVRWCVSDRPAVSGLLIWDHGISETNIGKLHLPVTAVSWHPHCDAGLSVCLYSARHHLADMMQDYGEHGKRRVANLPPGALEQALLDLPPLLPVWSTEVATTTEWTPAIPTADFNTIMTTLYATWVLMAQPGIADQTPQEVEPRVRKAIARSGRPVPDVTLVELRRKQRPGRQAEHADQGDGKARRTYRHQWVVPGFWRNQACGPGWSQHKKIWINDHTKGPDGAPMLTRVNVLRR